MGGIRESLETKLPKPRQVGSLTLPTAEEQATISRGMQAHVRTSITSRQVTVYDPLI